VYTLPLPESEEHCVRIQNFELPDLITTAIRVFEAIAEIKGRTPVIMYDPIYFEHGEYGDTGSLIDSDWYQSAIRAGTAKPTPFKAIRAAMQGGPPAGYGAGAGYDEGYGYEESYGYETAGAGYDDGYGYDAYGYEDPNAGYGEEYYAPPPPRPLGAPPTAAQHHSVYEEVKQEMEVAAE